MQRWRRLCPPRYGAWFWGSRGRRRPDRGCELERDNGEGLSGVGEGGWRGVWKVGEGFEFEEESGVY